MITQGRVKRLRVKVRKLEQRVEDAKKLNKKLKGEQGAAGKP